MEAVDFSPRMPEVEKDFEEGAIALAKELASDHAKRQMAILTPGRNVKRSKTLPPPEELPPGNRNILESIAPSARPQFIVAIGMTEVNAFQSNPYRAVPFLNVLEGLVQIGHAVLLFEGHSSALSAVCKDADLLLVDEAMIPFLQADWMTAAESGMKFPCVLKIKRGEGGFGGARWLDNPRLP